MEKQQGSSVVQTLVTNLSVLNMQLKSMGESLKKLESNEIESFKNNYEFKFSVIGEIKNLGQEINNIQSIFKDMSAKMDINDKSVSTALTEIKDGIENIPAPVSSEGSSEKYKLLSEERGKWVKRLWGVVIVLGLSVLALLGLNLFGIVKLPFGG